MNGGNAAGQDGEGVDTEERVGRCEASEGAREVEPSVAGVG
jgi:hypothetical protein